MTHQTQITDIDPIESLSDLVKTLLDRREMIEAALVYADGTHTFQDVVERIIQGRYLFWNFDKSCMVMETIQYPQTKHMNIMLAAGDLEEILKTQDTLTTVAKSQGCSALTMSGRPGWGKPLIGQLGWKETCRTFKFDIGEQDG